MSDVVRALAHDAADEGNRTTEDATRPATESYGRTIPGDHRIRPDLAS